MATLVFASEALATTLSLSTGNTRYYYYDVPSGSASVTITLRGSNGDADLYVRRGERPRIGNFSGQWRAVSSNSNETITISNPIAGRYRIAVHAYRSFSSVRVAASSTSSPPTATDLTNRSFTISGAQNSQRFYRVTVPSNATRLTVTTSGGTGDVDLYVRRGSLPSRTSYTARSTRNSNNDSVTIHNPAAGTYYVMARGWRSYSGARLTGSVAVPSPATSTFVGDLTNRSRTASSVRGGWRFYRVTVPSNASRLVVSSGRGSGDVDLYVRRGSYPTRNAYTGRSIRAFTNSESITINNPSAGTYYVGAYAYRDFSNARVSSSVSVQQVLPAPRASATRAMTRYRTISGSFREFSFETRIRNRSNRTFYVQRFEDVRVNGVNQSVLAMLRPYRIDPGERSLRLGGLATKFRGRSGQRVSLGFTAIVTYDRAGLGREYRLRWSPRNVRLP